MSAALPLALRQPTLDAFAKGHSMRLRRPAGGIYARTQVGDRLWIREPYRLEFRFDSFRPTSAQNMGAKPFFCADLQPGDVESLGLGPVRYARNLLRVWHRWHATVIRVDPVPLQEISVLELEALGYRSSAAFAADWDRDVTSFTGRFDDRIWQNNPTVLAITVMPQHFPHPEDDPRTAAEFGSRKLADAIAAQGGMPS